MKVPYKQIKAYVVAGITFACVSKWNGMEEWRDQQGRVLVVARDPSMQGPLASALADTISGITGGEIAVMSASPELISELQKAQQEAKAQPCSTT